MENRFKLLSEADLESLSSKSESTNTKRSTSTWLNVYHALANKARNKKSDLESYPPHELDSILCQNFVLFRQILIHTINSESHGFFGQFWENRPSYLF